ncbi:hypothetical protein SAMN02927921_01976 [Sinomicrobium oceani]|uniref:Uncharacterized protein n=1 Tax=Sinomicrobium oceani TaxID=1150368 RepID=A0A1K1PRP0_9FLAO|nr:hypothetical protein [Sinomicrobium oceani]SFW50225.1 hypothetical protein SAMN02927921_01976 [Sinomicrobium oceani]
MSIKLQKFEIEKKKLESLPLFYNYILYNDFPEADAGVEECVSFNEKLNCYQDHTPPEKIISKFIDFSKD